MAASGINFDGTFAVGMAEVPFLSICAVVADAMGKAAHVILDGIETTGDQRLMIRVFGDPESVEESLRVAEATARDLGVTAVTECIRRPEPALKPLYQFANSVNSLFGGKDQFTATAESLKEYNKMSAQQAIGILETQGLTAILEATDTMLKAANVELVGKEKIGAAYVTIMIRGDVAAVKAAIDAGSEAVGALGKLIAAHVIARPHADLAKILPGGV